MNLYAENFICRFVSDRDLDFKRKCIFSIEILIKIDYNYKKLDYIHRRQSLQVKSQGLILLIDNDRSKSIVKWDHTTELAVT